MRCRSWSPSLFDLRSRDKHKWICRRSLATLDLLNCALAIADLHVRSPGWPGQCSDELRRLMFGIDHRRVTAPSVAIFAATAHFKIIAIQRVYFTKRCQYRVTGF